jgi:hypothetical protein
MGAFIETRECYKEREAVVTFHEIVIVRAAICERSAAFMPLHRKIVERFGNNSSG